MYKDKIMLNNVNLEVFIRLIYPWSNGNKNNNNNFSNNKEKEKEMIIKRGDK